MRVERERESDDWGANDLNPLPSLFVGVCVCACVSVRARTCVCGCVQEASVVGVWGPQ